MKNWLLEHGKNKDMEHAQLSHLLEMGGQDLTFCLTFLSLFKAFFCKIYDVWSPNSKLVLSFDFLFKAFFMVSKGLMAWHRLSNRCLVS